jgi:hypothetical protein
VLALVGVAVACFVFRQRRQAPPPERAVEVELPAKAIATGPANPEEGESLGVSISDSD